MCFMNDERCGVHETYKIPWWIRIIGVFGKTNSVVDLLQMYHGFLWCGTMILSFSRDVEATCITSREKEGMLVWKL